MNERISLLAHLVPSLTSQTENAATKSLAYILNKSETVMGAMNELICSGVGEKVEPICEVRLEVTAEDQSRPDFVGYDADRAKRVIGESKFWASLGKGQGSVYLGQLAPGPSVLIYVVPEARIGSLWNDALGDIKGGDEGFSVQQLRDSGSLKVGKVSQGERYVLMVSWRSLLDSLLLSCMSDAGVQSDLHQLRGLTELMDSEAFLPLKKDDLSPEIPRRQQQFVKLVMDATKELGNRGDLVTWTGPITSSHNSCGRYFTISGSTVWLGVHFDLWGQGETEDTPLWLQLYNLQEAALAHVSRKLGLRAVGWYGNYFQVTLPLDVELAEVHSSVVSQLEQFAEAIGSAPLT